MKIGIIQIARGNGYFSHPDLKDEIEIPHEYLNTALNGDTVEVDIEKKRVRKIIQRAKTRFVGRAETEGKYTFIVPDDAKMYRDILVVKKDSKRAKEGYKVVIEMEPWTDAETNPQGHIVEVLGKAGEHETEMRSIVLSKGFDIDFPEEVTKEARNIQLTIDEAGRRDMRGVLTCTIDPIDAKDFDDALSIKFLDDGNYEIGIHIADVSHYVREGSALDKEALNRGFSIYLVDRTIPMLPLELSTDICSLNPNEDRLAFSAVFTMTPEGHVLDRWFGKTIIHSDKRFSYEEAQEILDAQKGDLLTELQTLNILAKKLQTKNAQTGAIDFETDEIRFELNEDMIPVKIYKKERLDTHKLVEEFMLLANREVAEHMYHVYNKKDKETRPGVADKGSGEPFIYRVHELPNEEKIETLTQLLKALGYNVKIGRKDITPKDITKILNMVSGKPEESFIKTATIRSMAKAIYSTKNFGHFGLAFQYYTHFTSPIRRYSDLLVHRLLQKELQGMPEDSKETPRYQKLAMQTSENEVRAADAERDSIKYKQVEYMKEHIGETFDALISGVTEYGLYVQDKITLAEGLLHISALGDDFYEYNEKTYSLIGRKNKKVFRLGDSIQVKLTKADLEKRQLDFVTV